MIANRLSLLFVALCLLTGFRCLSQAGTPDLSFVPPSLIGFSHDLALQPDGKILVTGIPAGTSTQLIRLHTDGSMDTTFKLTGTGFDQLVHTVALQPDGKIIAAGYFDSYNGVSDTGIARLNADGSLDTTFHVGRGFNWHNPYQCEVQPDGKIVVAGGFLSYQGVPSCGIVRINTDGSRDASFVTGTGFNDGVNKFAIQPDGKIIAGGWFTSYNGVSCNRLVRLNTDGSLDNTFNTGLGFDTLSAFAIALRPDGRILVGGRFLKYNGLVCNRIIQLLSNGTRDNSFNTGSGFNDDWVNDIILQPDGKAVASGFFTSYNGSATYKRIIRLNEDGTPDAVFNDGNGFDDSGCFVLLRQPDGKILGTGGFSSYNGVTRTRVVRINSDKATGVEEISSEKKPSLFPNPAHDRVYVRTSEASALLISDVTGREHKLVPLSAPDTCLSLEGLAPGVYTVTILSGSTKVKSEKLVIE